MDYTRLFKRLEPEPDGETPVRHRSAVVDAVNTDGTVDIELSGVVIPGVSVLDGAHVAAGDTVQVTAWAGDLLVLGRARVSANAGSVLGYAQTTSNVTGITGTAVNLAITGSLVVPPNRYIKLTGTWWFALSTIAGDRVNIRLASSAVHQEQVVRLPVAATGEEGGTISATFDSGAGGGAIAYAIQAQRFSGTGSVTIGVSATAPISITAQDLGPA